MEEILASIRRIIADDQSLPGRGGVAAREAETREVHHAPREPDVQAENRATSGESFVELRGHDEKQIETPPAMSTFETPPLVDQSEDGASTKVTTDAPATTRAYGPVATPQFPMPDGPVGDGLAQETSSPREASHANAPLTGAVAEAAAAPAYEPRPPTSAMNPVESRPDDDAQLYHEPLHAPPPAAETPLFSAATDTAVSSAFNMLAASRLADNSDELMNLTREMIRPMLQSWLDDNLPSMVERMVRAEIERVARGGR